MKVRYSALGFLVALVGWSLAPGVAQARVLADKTVSGTVTIKFPAGVQVYYSPAVGSYGLSNCTRDETSTDFKLTSSGEVRRFEFVAKQGGSCAFEPSYQVWKFVVARTPGGPAISSGAWELGQQHAGESFFVDCSSTHGQPWNNFQCKKLDTTAIEVSPGS